MVKKLAIAINLPNKCKHPRQFECWNPGKNTDIEDGSTYNKIKEVTDRVYDGYDGDDPTDGADHYNNPDKEGYPQWTENCDRKAKIGN